MPPSYYHCTRPDKLATQFLNNIALSSEEARLDL
jgi:hypothetical protein